MIQKPKVTLPTPMKENEKTQLSFVFKGIPITGYIISSTDLQPHFHWFLFEDVNLIQTFGDSVAFKIENGVLKPVSIAVNHKEFIYAIQECVREYLESSKE